MAGRPKTRPSTGVPLPVLSEVFGTVRDGARSGVRVSTTEQSPALQQRLGALHLTR